MIMILRLWCCLSCWYLVWIFISDMLGLLLMNSGVLLSLFIVCVILV